MSYYYPENVHLTAAASSADEVVLCFHERMEVVACKVVAIEADVTAHAANYAEIKVSGNDKGLNSSIQLLQLHKAHWTADAPVDMIDQGNTDKAIFDAGTALKVRLSKAGAGVDADVTVAIHRPSTLY
ncbi:MAG: hypothetical protein CM15mV149_160 [uncultured marine virus]|nr:MAG: hypothetical protein CM15mV149_160 [uncultured marine virus]